MNQGWKVGGLGIGLALIAGVTLSAAAPERWSRDWCEQRWQTGSEHACEVREVALARRPEVLHVDPGENGGVEVAAGSGPGIVVHAKVEAWAPSEAAARALIAQVRVTTDAGRLGAEGPTASAGHWGVSFRVEAPAEQSLDLRALNGPLGVYDMSGKMALETENGPITIVGSGGEVLARATNGPVSVRLSGHAWRGRGLDARSVNGPASLSLPSVYDADLEYGTQNGPWAGVGSRVEVGRRSGFAHARLGKGGAALAITTENGPFSMSRTSR
ncbi:MAG: hypothetical protein ABI960_02980 [Candidatus Eisenbacteria bacterium]